MKSPVDRGWAWVILAASFCNLYLCSITYTTGIYNVALLQYYDESKAWTAVCCSTHISLLCFSGPLSSFLSSVIGPHRTIVVGGVFLSLGFILSFYANSMIYVFITYGILAGLGSGLAYTPGVVIVGHYFKRYRNLAYGTLTTAMGVGTMTLAPLVEFLIEKYGIHGSMLIVGGIMGNLFPIGMLIIPFDKGEEILTTNRTASSKQTHIKDLNSDLTLKGTKDDTGFYSPETCAQKYKISSDLDFSENCRYDNTNFAECNNNSVINGETMEKDLDIFEHDIKKQQTEFAEPKNMKITIFGRHGPKVPVVFTKLLSINFIIICFSVLMLHIGLLCVYLHFPAYSAEQGTPMDMLGVLVTTMGIGNIICRILTGIITNNNKQYLIYIVYITASFMTAIISLAGPYMARSLTGQFLFAFSFSFFGNNFITLMSPILIDLLGVDALNSAWSLAALMSGVGILVGPTLAGLVYDSTGDYFYTFIISGVSYAVGGLVVFIVVIVKHSQQRSANNQSMRVITKKV